jgi:uncharacterized protein (TIGR00251 family)
MKIYVKVKPKAKTERFAQTDETHFSVSVKEPPVEGRANEAVVKALAAHFGVSRSRIALISGGTAREKAFEITMP